MLKMSGFVGVSKVNITHLKFNTNLYVMIIKEVIKNNDFKKTIRDY